VHHFSLYYELLRAFIENCIIFFSSKHRGSAEDSRLLRRARRPGRVRSLLVGLHGDGAAAKTVVGQPLQAYDDKGQSSILPNK
jgi:hypothetical protein